MDCKPFRIQETIKAVNSTLQQWHVSHQAAEHRKRTVKQATEVQSKQQGLSPGLYLFQLVLCCKLQTARYTSSTCS